MQPAVAYDGDFQSKNRSQSNFYDNSNNSNIRTFKLDKLLKAVINVCPELCMKDAFAEKSGCHGLCNHNPSQLPQARMTIC